MSQPDLPFSEKLESAPTQTTNSNSSESQQKSKSDAANTTNRASGQNFTSSESFFQKLSILFPRGEYALLIPLSEWKRLRVSVSEMYSGKKIKKLILNACPGFAGGSLIAFVTNLGGSILAVGFSFAIFSASLFGSLILLLEFIVDRKLTKSSNGGPIKEMDDIEKKYYSL
jgi:hypothetical protein